MHKHLHRPKARKLLFAITKLLQKQIRSSKLNPTVVYQVGSETESPWILYACATLKKVVKVRGLFNEPYLFFHGF